MTKNHLITAPPELVELRSRVEALERMYETQRLATLEWGKDVDKLTQRSDKHLRRIIMLEAKQQPTDAIAAKSASAGIVKDHLSSRAQRLIEEFEEAKDVRHGIANVLTHLAYAFGDPESWYAVPAETLDELADELTAPTLLDRALAGDKAAAKQFLQDLGMIDQHGQLTGIYAPEPNNQEDYE